MLKRAYHKVHKKVSSRLESDNHIRSAMPVVILLAVVVVLEVCALGNSVSQEEDDAQMLSRIHSMKATRHHHEARAMLPVNVFPLDERSNLPGYFDIRKGDNGTKWVYSWSFDGDGDSREIIFRRYSFDISLPGVEVLRSRVGQESSGLITSPGVYGEYLLPHQCEGGMCIGAYRMNPVPSAKEIHIPGMSQIYDARLVGSSLLVLGAGHEGTSLVVIDKIDGKESKHLSLESMGAMHFYLPTINTSRFMIANADESKMIAIDMTKEGMNASVIRGFFPHGVRRQMDTYDGEIYAYADGGSVFLWDPETQVSSEIVRNVSFAGEEGCGDRRSIHGVHFDSPNELMIETPSGVYAFDENARSMSMLYRFREGLIARPEVLSFKSPYLFLSDGRFVNLHSGDVMVRKSVNKNEERMFFDAID